MNSTNPVLHTGPHQVITLWNYAHGECGFGALRLRATQREQSCRKTQEVLKRARDVTTRLRVTRCFADHAVERVGKTVSLDAVVKVDASI